MGLGTRGEGSWTRDPALRSRVWRLYGCSRFGMHGRALTPAAPLRFEPKSIDTEFAEELEMGAQVVCHRNLARRRCRRTAPHQALDSIEDGGCHPILALERDRLLAVLADERHGIGFDVEAAIWL